MTPLEILTIVTQMLGGLALFLSGMGSMSNALSAMTEGKLNRIIHKVTKNRFMAFIFGAGLTALVQSASATTVLTVGLVNSGLIKFTEAIGLIIGANLGTTANAWILSLNSIDGESFIMTIIKPTFFAPYLAIIGVAINMFSHSQKKKDAGAALLGFSIMMIGMAMMSQAIEPLKEMQSLTDMLIRFTNPVLGFLFACLFTMLIQSSDATIGILLAFAHSIGVTYGMAIPLICGAQVGTCITALLSSLGGSNNGKRTALLNLYYNLLKTIPFLCIFYLLKYFLDFSLFNKNVGIIGIPLAHTFINLCGIVVWLPLSGVIVYLARKTIPLSEKEKQAIANNLTMLDDSFLKTPSMAIEQADRAVIMLSDIVGEAFLAAIDLRENPERIEHVNLLCERARRYHEQIDSYLSKIIALEIGKVERANVSLLSTGSTAFGRMGKIAGRLQDMITNFGSYGEKLTERDRKDIHIMGQAIFEIVQLTIKGFSARTTNLSYAISYYTEEVLNLSQIVKRNYVQRVHNEGIERSGDTLFPDICHAEEQLIDYCDMIGEALIRFDRESGGKEGTRFVPDEKTRYQIHMIFKDKIEELQKD